jgi:hypothetical protein
MVIWHRFGSLASTGLQVFCGFPQYLGVIGEHAESGVALTAQDSSELSFSVAVI